MERPQLYFCIFPFAIASLVIYVRMLFVLRKRKGLFYKLVRTQAVFDITYVLLFFVSEIPQDIPQLYSFLFSLNESTWGQLIFAHMLASVNGQIIGVTMHSICRMILIRFSRTSLAKVIDNLSIMKVMLIHYSFPFLFGLFVFFVEPPTQFDFVSSLDRVTRVINLNYVRVNSFVAMFASVLGAITSSVCYVLIFATLRKRPMRSWNVEASIIFTSFALFLCLCGQAVYWSANGIFSIVDHDAMYALRKHYYAFSFPFSLLNPWCLLLTNPRIRIAMFGRICSNDDAVVRLSAAKSSSNQEVKQSTNA